MKNLNLLAITVLCLFFIMPMAGVEITAYTTGVGLLFAAVVAFAMPRGVVAEISLAAARDPFTNAVVARYSEDISVPGFFRSFFRNVFSPTKQVTFAVKRSGEKVAVDILRGTGPKLTSKTRSTINTLTPPYFAYAHNVNELDIYDTAWSTLNPEALGQLAALSAEQLIENRKLIERRYELQCREVLISGIVTLNSGDNIDYKREAASMPTTSSGDYWTVDTVDPMVLIEQGGKFIREVGKAQGGIYNVVIGAQAWAALESNPIFQKKYDIRHIMIGDIGMPQANGTGATYRGQVAGASYIYNLWTYPEVYEAENGDIVPYMPEDMIIVLPTATQFEMSFAQVPMLQGVNGNFVQPMGDGQFWFKEYLDPKHDNHVQEIRSAGIPIPTAIDTIFSVKVVA